MSVAEKTKPTIIQPNKNGLISRKSSLQTI